jgi:hypothetical protein
VIKGIEKTFGKEPPYNAVHLRMEVGFGAVQNNVGGRAGLWELYKPEIDAADMNPDAPLLVASGLIQAGFSDPMDFGRFMFYTGDMLCHKVRRRKGKLQSMLTSVALQRLSNHTVILSFPFFLSLLFQRTLTISASQRVSRTVHLSASLACANCNRQL